MPLFLSTEEAEGAVAVLFLALGAKNFAFGVVESSPGLVVHFFEQIIQPRNVRRRTFAGVFNLYRAPCRVLPLPLGVSVGLFDGDVGGGWHPDRLCSLGSEISAVESRTRFGLLRLKLLWRELVLGGGRRRADLLYRGLVLFQLRRLQRRGLKVML